jgi:hypothetical protein
MNMLVNASEIRTADVLWNALCFFQSVNFQSCFFRLADRIQFRTLFRRSLVMTLITPLGTPSACD